MPDLKLLLAGAAFMLPALSLATAHAQDQKNVGAPYEPKACSARITPAPAIANDPDLLPAVRNFLVKLDKNSSPFWTLPQPKPQESLTELQNQTPVDMSGVKTTERELTADGRTVKLFVMKPDHMEEHPGVILFLHGGVWIVGNFENHKRLLRDLVVDSGQPAVFLEYTVLPNAKYPVQMNEAYAALEWTAAHASEFGADPNRIAVAGNSVGGVGLLNALADLPTTKAMIRQVAEEIRAHIGRYRTGQFD